MLVDALYKIRASQLQVLDSEEKRLTSSLG